MSLTIPVSPELEQQLQQVAEAVGISPEAYMMQLLRNNLAAHPIDTELLDKMVQTIVDVAAPEKIILFGSRVKGTARENSDYDFLVIDAEPFSAKHSRRKVTGRIGRALAHYRVSTDILMYTVDEVAEWRDSQNHVIFHALNEGKVLYERSEKSERSFASR